MLASLRKGSEHLIVKIFLGLIAFSFVIWGVGDIFQGGVSNTVATIGNHKISMQQLDNIVRQQARLYPNVDPSLIRTNILHQFIGQKLLLSEVERLGLDISNDVLAQKVREIPAFLDQEGKFDKNLFSTRLRTAGVSEEEFFQSFREDTLVSILLKTIQAGPVTIEAEAPLLYQYRNEQRKVDTISIPFDHVKNISDPTEAELVQYYEQYKEEFKAPEFRTASYAVVDCNTLPLTKLDDAKLKEIYEESNEQGAYNIAESFNLEQLRFNTKEEAEVAYAKLKSGKDFVSVRKESNIPEASTYLGDVVKSGLPSELSDKVFALKTGQYSEPLESPLGFHIFKVNKVTPAYTKTFEEVRPDLVESAGRTQVCQNAQEVFAKLDDHFAGGESLKEVGSQYDIIKVEEVGPIDREGQGAGNNVSGFPKYLATEEESKQHFISQVFEAEAGGDAVVFTPDHGVFVALQVTGSNSARYRALDEVKGLVIDAWKKNKQKEESLKLAQTTAERLTKGESMATLANSMGVKVETTTEVRVLPENDPFAGVENVGKSLPEALHNDIFQRNINGVSEVMPTNNGYALAVVKQIIPVTDLTSDKAKAGIVLLQDELKQQWMDDLMSMYMAGLKKRYPVEINEQVLNAEAGSQ